MAATLRIEPVFFVAGPGLVVVGNGERGAGEGGSRRTFVADLKLDRAAQAQDGDEQEGKEEGDSPASSCAAHHVFWCLNIVGTVIYHKPRSTIDIEQRWLINK